LVAREEYFVGGAYICMLMYLYIQVAGAYTNNYPIHAIEIGMYDV
jgi:hypothetical protein